MAARRSCLGERERDEAEEQKTKIEWPIRMAKVGVLWCGVRI